MGEADDLKIAVKSTKKLCIAVKKGDAIFVGQYIFTTLKQLQFCLRS
ncbi:unnamed protein product [Brassica oleracea]